MIKKLLSGKKRFTLSECAQGCDCTEKDILQFASEGNIYLQANLAYTEGDLYVTNDSIDTPKELKQRSWKGYQTLTPNFCEKLLRNFDKEVSITSIVATQEEREEFNLDYNDTVEISLDPSIIVSGDPLDPLGSNIQKDYQYITTKDVWVSREEYERLRSENEGEMEQLVKISTNKETTRTFHTDYLASQAIAESDKPLAFWRKIKQLAGESRGETRINVEGAGYVYLKYAKSAEGNAVWYSWHKFEHSEDGTLLKKSTFDEAFRLEKKKQKMSKSKKSQR
ncbi:MAG: hypothetical protein ISR65_20345 [Bacteriovoracaceae bacterium]|nr:hypothetical protein [Bacteriovoracaceae bacterium]